MKSLIGAVRCGDSTLLTLLILKHWDFGVDSPQAVERNDSKSCSTRRFEEALDLATSVFLLLFLGFEATLDSEASIFFCFGFETALDLEVSFFFFFLFAEALGLGASAF
jgi:hypothetical protein